MSLDERIKKAESQRKKAKAMLKNNRWKLKYLKAKKQLKLDGQTIDIGKRIKSKYHVNSYDDFMNKYDVKKKSGQRVHYPFD